MRYDQTFLRLFFGAVALILPTAWLATAPQAEAGSGYGSKLKPAYWVKVKLKHYIDDAPDYTESYWTKLRFSKGKGFSDGDFHGDWKKDGEEYQADVSDDYEDWLEWEFGWADDVDGWFKYYDIEVYGDQIQGRIKGEIDAEYEFWFFSEDYEEKLKGSFTGYAVDD
jgi:hypothetical protein